MQRGAILYLLKLSTIIFFSVCAFHPLSASAKGAFSPAIVVNGKPITKYEMQQRIKLLSTLGFPGDLDEVAKEQLIDEKLKELAATELGVEVDTYILDLELQNFSERLNLSLEQLDDLLDNTGVRPDTLRSYVKNQIIWRSFIQSSILPQINIDERQLLQSLTSNASGSSIEVLLTEIIIATSQENQASMQKLAKDLSKIRTIQNFSEAARLHSDAPTRNIGGLVTWQRLNTLPEVLQSLIFGLAPGDVTPPLTIPNGIALFQLRDIRETNFEKKDPTSVTFMTYSAPLSEISVIDEILSQIDSCDDLYRFEKLNQLHTLRVETVLFSELDFSMRGIITNLDENEHHTYTKDETVNSVILCERATIVDLSERDMIKLKEGLLNKRLSEYADSYLRNLREDARIIFYD